MFTSKGALSLRTMAAIIPLHREVGRRQPAGPVCCSRAKGALCYPAVPGHLASTRLGTAREAWAQGVWVTARAESLSQVCAATRRKLSICALPTLPPVPGSRSRAVSLVPHPTQAIRTQEGRDPAPQGAGSSEDRPSPTQQGQAPAGRQGAAWSGHRPAPGTRVAPAQLGRRSAYVRPAGGRARVPEGAQGPRASPGTAGGRDPGAQRRAGQRRPGGHPLPGGGAAPRASIRERRGGGGRARRGSGI